jgi:hypothetical protein
MSKFPVAAALAALACTFPVHAEKKTVCSITVNSSDEKDAFKARLPKGEYEFVELLEKGRPDWLRSSCQRGVQCDVLVVSGHFNAGDTFYSDKVDVQENLNVDELERASCSDSCPGLFAKLKEVYLFGCESLNPDSSKYASSHGESGRDRMRRIFANVPVIYGFSGAAPVGATAASLLNRYFDSGSREIATGRASARMLSAFSRNSMVATSGVRESEPGGSQRRQICQYFDERKDSAEKLRFIHRMMRASILDAGASFDRIEKLMAAIGEPERQSAAFTQALAEVSADDATRSRYLAFARTREASLRLRMIALASTLGWLAPDERRAETIALVNELMASRASGYSEVDLVCSANARGELDGGLASVKAAPGSAREAAQSAMFACLGSDSGRGATLRALASGDENDVRIAQVYLRHRPIADASELRGVARDIVDMPASPAQVRALDTLARMHIGDRQVLLELAQSFASARNADVQRAIAEIFIRSDPKAIPRTQLVSAIREHRVRTAGGRSDLIDVLMTRLQAGA